MGRNAELWRTIELCWLEDHNARLGIEDIFSYLNNATVFWYMSVLASDARAERYLHTSTILSSLVFPIPLLFTCLLYMMGPHILVKHNQHMTQEGELAATGDFMNDRPL